MSRTLRLHSSTLAATLGVIIGGCDAEVAPTCGTSDPCATGGTLAMGGSSSTGGSATGGTAGSAAGGAAGSATGGSPPDLTCNTDDDCCVEVNRCLTAAAVYSKLSGPWITWPVPEYGCYLCYIPIVDVRCLNNWCEGQQISDYLQTENGTAHCGRLPSGTGGTTGTGGAASAGGSSPSTSTSGGAASPQGLFAPSPAVLPVFGCGV